MSTPGNESVRDYTPNTLLDPTSSEESRRMPGKYPKNSEPHVCTLDWNGERQLPIRTRIKLEADDGASKNDSNLRPMPPIARTPAILQPTGEDTSRPSHDVGYGGGMEESQILLPLKSSPHQAVSPIFRKAGPGVGTAPSPTVLRPVLLSFRKSRTGKVPDLRIFPVEECKKSTDYKTGEGPPQDDTGDWFVLDAPSKDRLSQGRNNTDSGPKLRMPEAKNGATLLDDPRSRKSIGRVLKNRLTGSDRPPTGDN